MENLSLMARNTTNMINVYLDQFNLMVKLKKALPKINNLRMRTTNRNRA